MLAMVFISKKFLTRFLTVSLMSKMKMADGPTIVRRNRPGTKAKVQKIKL